MILTFVYWPSDGKFYKRLDDSGIDSNADDAQSEALANKYVQALVIDQEGINLGVVNVAKVWATAKESNLKMTLVRESEPPVIKLEHKLTARDAREKKKKKEVDSEALHDRVKEVRLSDLITEHDLQVKVSKIQQLLFTKHRVRITLQFKRRADFDASVGKAFLDNVLMRISEFSITEGSLVTADDRACAVTVRPISRAQLIAKGFIEAPKEEAEHTPTRKEITAEKRRLAELEREELKAQGLLVKKYLSPEEQSKLYAEQVSKGIIKPEKQRQGYDRADDNDDDEFRR